jgi:AcrR family transcriptional regulator
MNSISQPTNARSRRTRAALLTAARDILETDGFAALTMTAVAEQAGVTRRSVYMHFPSRAELVGCLFDHVARTEGLEESLQQVWDAPDAVAGLDEWAHHLARYHPRLLAVTRAVAQVHRSDPDAAAHRQRVVSAQLTNCHRLVTWLDDSGQLSPVWTVETATDMLWALISTDMIEGLLVDRHWSQEELGRHLGLLLRRAFTTA